MSPVAEPADERADAASAGSHPTDSAGVPWAGRSFQPNPHAADDGRAPEALAAAVRRFRSGEGGQAEVVAAFGGSRLLIPLLADLGDGGAELGEHGLPVDKSQELSIVTVEGPDGRRVLPVFASVEAMSAWNPVARPVPPAAVRPGPPATPAPPRRSRPPPRRSGATRPARSRGCRGSPLGAGRRTRRSSPWTRSLPSPMCCSSDAGARRGARPARG